MSILCGTGRRIINPEIGHRICGYGPDYANAGIHDDITVTALYLHDGERAAVFLNYDLIGMMAPSSRRIRTAVAQAIGIPIDHVHLACTHVHSGPDTLAPHPFSKKANPGFREDYFARLVEWSTQAAVEAKDGAEACELRYNFAEVDGNMNRRFNFPDRRSLYIPDNKQLIGQSREYVDREFGVIAFRKIGTANRYKAIITNYTCHPLCVGNSSDLITADFPGVIRRTVEETFAGCHCLTTTGAAGDNHPLMPESGFASALEMGTRLGRIAIMRAYDSVPVEDTRLRLAYPDVSLAPRDPETLRMLPEHQARSRPLREDRSELTTQVSLFGIGPVLFAGFPGEPMAEHGAMLKWSSPFLKSYALFTATDFLGYFPTVNQFHWGGYEPNTSPFARDAGARLVGNILDHAQRLLREQPLDLPVLESAGVDGSPRK
ncbi:MAG: neutral/alkaline non-lysosomal ceramidase N-terminal domain-containing protein [Planctomycetes bacterium]|nr:neutral/alkaline non-lysosomal ceramidase N-terminal domain-containing protein [Planctomycetota bacterium]